MFDNQYFFRKALIIFGIKRFWWFISLSWKFDNLQMACLVSYWEYASSILSFQNGFYKNERMEVEWWNGSILRLNTILYQTWSYVEPEHCPDVAAVSIPCTEKSFFESEEDEERARVADQQCSQLLDDMFAACQQVSIYNRKYSQEFDIGNTYM